MTVWACLSCVNFATVFMHKKGTTAADIDKNYTSKNHSAESQNIGTLGGCIDISVIAKNLLSANKATAQNLAQGDWVRKVLPGAGWDYKNNTETIFGVAWKFDADAQSNSATALLKTSFAMGNTIFEDAAAFGNYHAGYTGTHAGVSQRDQFWWAGMGEAAKGFPDNWHRMVSRSVDATFGKYGTYGDQVFDFYWNHTGMVAAGEEIKREGRPHRTPKTDNYKQYQSPQIYRGFTF